MSGQETRIAFDPNAASDPESGLFGLPHGPGDAHVHVLGVPFEATTSYRTGTAQAPDAIRRASRQIDLFDLWFGRPYERGIWMAAGNPDIATWNREARSLAAPIIERGGAAEIDRPDAARVDALSEKVNAVTGDFTRDALAAGKLPVIVGGDHSTPFGAIEACASSVASLGVLQFDAHADLRPRFEGFTWSHASIMHNVLERCAGVTRLVQVGVRDLCEQEYDSIQTSERVHTVFDRQLLHARHRNDPRQLAVSTLGELPDDLWVSFDIDALDPALCPQTGTPVPGGLSWDEVMTWLEMLKACGKRILGIDLCEVSPGPSGAERQSTQGDTWDAIVGARLLYRLIGAAVK